MTVIVLIWNFILTYTTFFFCLYKKSTSISIYPQSHSYQIPPVWIYSSYHTTQPKSIFAPYHHREHLRQPTKLLLSTYLLEYIYNIPHSFNVFAFAVCSQASKSANNITLQTDEIKSSLLKYYIYRKRVRLHLCEQNI